MPIKKWKTLKSDYIIKRPWLTARRDEVQLPNGVIHDEYYVLEYPDWINVIAEDTEGNLIIEQQWRHALGIVSSEICAGVIETDEKPLDAAQRELQEETGYGSGTWTKLMTISANPSTMTNLCHCYLAKGVKPVSSQHLDRTEDIEFKLLPKERVFEMLKNGEFMQALMIAPLWKYFSEHL